MTLYQLDEDSQRDERLSALRELRKRRVLKLTRGRSPVSTHCYACGEMLPKRSVSLRVEQIESRDGVDCDYIGRLCLECEL